MFVTTTWYVKVPPGSGSDAVSANEPVDLTVFWTSIAGLTLTMLTVASAKSHHVPVRIVLTGDRDPVVDRVAGVARHVHV